MTSRAEQRRDYLIREIGCLACALWGYGFELCEKHHLNESDQPGRKRRGEKFTVGLCQWSHVGRCACTGAITDCRECKKRRGPSWRHHKREFIETFGDGDTLLAEQNRLIEAYMGSVVQ